METVLVFQLAFPAVNLYLVSSSQQAMESAKGRLHSHCLPRGGGGRGDAGTLLPWPPQRNLRALHSELTWLWPAVIFTQDVTWATEGEEGR